MNWETLLLFCSATAALAISPGPDNIYVLVQSLVNGRRKALSVVLGLMTGCIIHTSLLAFGVSAIIKANETLFFGIKILGALYLLFLAYKVYNSDGNISVDTENSESKTTKQLFIQGFFMNVLNPKVTIFFLAFFPSFLFSETLNTVIQFYVLGGLFILVSFVIFSAIALLAASIRQYLLANKNAGFVFKWLQIIVFVGIAIFILL
ncbi:LysE family translocator [Winogradskyella litorisediminis]|uniref:LysE family translocator n=1 Tax=Winogradskyella litorisediminis TaxID=1156618 RepID=A0ABW3NAG7_9FLAO